MLVHRQRGSLSRYLQQCVRQFAALPAEDHGAVSSSSAVQQQASGILQSAAGDDAAKCQPPSCYRVDKTRGVQYVQK